MRFEVVSLVGFSRRLAVGAGGPKINLYDSGVAITPLAVNKLNTFLGPQVDDRFGLANSVRILRLCYMARPGHERQNRDDNSCDKAHGLIPHSWLATFPRELS